MQQNTEVMRSTPHPTLEVITYLRNMYYGDYPLYILAPVLLYRRYDKWSGKRYVGVNLVSLLFGS